MKVQQHIEPRIPGEIDNLIELVEIRLGKLTLMGLQAAPVDGQPQDIESVAHHRLRIIHGKRRDRLQRHAPIVKCDIKQTLDAGVDTAQGELPPQLIHQAMIPDLDPG